MMATQDCRGDAGAHVQHVLRPPPSSHVHPTSTTASGEDSRVGSMSESLLSGPPQGLWPEPMVLPRTIDKLPDRPERAMATTTYADARNAVLEDLSGWTRFPPPPTEAFEAIHLTQSPYIASTEKLRDVEKITDEHIQQSTALRAWIIEKEKIRKNLGIIEEDYTNVSLLKIYERIAKEAPDHYTRTYAKIQAANFARELLPDHEKYVEEDRALTTDIGSTYADFLDIKRYEKHASLRRQHSETLKQQQIQPQPKQKESRAEQLLGTAARRSSPALPTDSNLYFVGAPPKLTKKPFDQAVAAGLEENAGAKRHRGSSGTDTPPITWRPWWDVDVPDWFEVLEEGKQVIENRDVHTRYRDLLNLINQLTHSMETWDAREMARKPEWDKQWHEPDPRWPYTKRQKHGGWWKCRGGPDAPNIERACLLCHSQQQQNMASKATAKLNPRETYNRIFKLISNAMDVIGQRDKEIVLAHMFKYDQEAKEEELRMRDLHRGLGELTLQDVQQTSGSMSDQDDGFVMV
ncbi:hypothetical protein F5B20DRAFT_381422 [Whalleya microplaca]|nr:hypothetical protein F5B20DRAFT_381422 [Whalleya microplaca]